MATQVKVANTSLVVNRATLEFDHSLLSGREANAVENFRSDFQRILDNAGLHARYKAKLIHQTASKPADTDGISLGTPSAYVIEVLYVESNRRYVWHICFAEKDTTAIQEKIERALNGEIIIPEEPPLEEKQKEKPESKSGDTYVAPEINVVFRDPHVAAQVLLTLWALTENDKLLPTAQLTDIFMHCYKQRGANNKVSSYHSVFMRRGYIEKSENNKEYRITPEGFAYIQEHQQLLLQSGKIKEVEEVFLKKIEQQNSVNARLKEVRKRLLDSQGPHRLPKSESLMLRTERNQLLILQEQIRQSDRALIRLRATFIHV